MPKFVSGSSGHIYSHKGADEDPDISSLIPDPNSEPSSKKPSAVNKRGTNEPKKNSLDLFKEELKRLQEAKEEQKTAHLKRSSQDQSSYQHHNDGATQHRPVLVKTKSTLVPVPLKPDPRCPTSLTLQVNVNPRDKESLSIGGGGGGGSHDNGDPATTNLYVGNINPAVNENDLCDIFGKYGPLASIKIMWPRTDEERARNRNSGFVAYMSRLDAGRALRALDGLNLKGYDMKLGSKPPFKSVESRQYQSIRGSPPLKVIPAPSEVTVDFCISPRMGWGKAVPIPKNPVYVPPELRDLLLPPPQSGLPFNAQLHDSDIERGYVVPTHYPQPLLADLDGELDHNPDLRAVKEAHDEFIGVLKRSTVRVVPPSDRATLDRIHKTIEYVIKEGPVFEAIIIARENRNPDYRFLTDNKGYEHIYYRWKLFSILNGDDPYEWRTEDFRMFENGSLWRPPPLNPFEGGMPDELICRLSSEHKEDNIKTNIKPNTDSCPSHNTKLQGTLDSRKRAFLGDLLENIEPTKVKVGASMMFCIDHADAAKEIIDSIQESLQVLNTPLNKELARLFLISDILNNCSATVTNASFYREGFQTKLVSIFECLRRYLVNIADIHEADRFKHKILSVLGAWKEWTLYENEFLVQLSNILLGIEWQDKVAPLGGLKLANPPAKMGVNADLDGVEVDEETLSRCLESKGLSLRWYMTLELSDDEEDLGDDDGASGAECSLAGADDRMASAETVSSKERVKFKSSKWETLDPTEVAGQVVTISKWEAMAKAEEEGITDSSSSDSSPAAHNTANRNEEESPRVTTSGDQSSLKRMKMDPSQ